MTRTRRIALASIVFFLVTVLLAGELWFLFDRATAPPPMDPDRIAAPLYACGAESPCEPNEGCYVFEDLPMPVCWEGDPCVRCASGRCIIMESYPAQVRCEA